MSWFIALMSSLLVFMGALLGLMFAGMMEEDTRARCTHFAVVPVMECTAFNASRDCITWKPAGYPLTLCTERPW